MKKISLFVGIILLNNSLYSHPFRGIITGLRARAIQQRHPHSQPHSQEVLTQLAKLKENYYKQLDLLTPQEKSLEQKKIQLQKEFNTAKKALFESYKFTREQTRPLYVPKLSSSDSERHNQ